MKRTTYQKILDFVRENYGESEVENPSYDLEALAYYIQYDDFAQLYSENYAYLYNHEAYQIPDWVLDSFDEKMKSDSNFKRAVEGFCKYRGDILSSDREVAAFMYSYYYFKVGE